MAETNIDRLTMRAPIAGVILQNRVRLGQFAQLWSAQVNLS